MIVTDWIWVSRLRAEGETYAFIPYSKMVGALMVPDDSPIRSLDDLKGKRIGIAGGPVDKSWLLIRGLAERSGLDLDAQVEKIFGAPPLLNQQILSGELDAVVNFWHFNARLEAAGYRRLVQVDKIAADFGVESEVPLIGYVFNEALAESQRDDILGFVRASRKAKEILRTSDAEWERLRPLMKAKNDATF
jgi:NitT/TauT family transport system substrate-binding protein